MRFVERLHMGNRRNLGLGEESFKFTIDFGNASHGLQKALKPDDILEIELHVLERTQQRSKRSAGRNRKFTRFGLTGDVDHVALRKDTPIGLCCSMAQSSQ